VNGTGTPPGGLRRPRQPRGAAGVPGVPGRPWALLMPPLFALYGESLMQYTGAHENGSTAHGYARWPCSRMTSSRPPSGPSGRAAPGPWGRCATHPAHTSPHTSHQAPHTRHLTPHTRHLTPSKSARTDVAQRCADGPRWLRPLGPSGARRSGIRTPGIRTARPTWVRRPGAARCSPPPPTARRRATARPCRVVTTLAVVGWLGGRGIFVST
jgi:hypothetical protein